MGETIKAYIPDIYFFMLYNIELLFQIPAIKPVACTASGVAVLLLDFHAPRTKLSLVWLGAKAR